MTIHVAASTLVLDPGGSPWAWLAMSRPDRPRRAAEVIAPDAGGATSEALVERLFVKLEAPLTSTLYRWLWDREAVRDVVQEAFVRLWRMRARVEWERAEPLVYRIAINLAASRRRQLRLRRWVSLEDEQADAGAPAAEAADAQLERAQEEATVRAAIEALPERQRRVLVLCTFSDLSYQEIGDALGISPGTVASRRNAAVARIKRQLERGERR